jgi:hypothetical protein
MDCSQWDRRDGEGSHQYAALLAASKAREALTRHF